EGGTAGEDRRLLRPRPAEAQGAGAEPGLRGRGVAQGRRAGAGGSAADDGPGAPGGGDEGAARGVNAPRTSCFRWRFVRRLFRGSTMRRLPFLLTLALLAGCGGRSTAAIPEAGELKKLPPGTHQQTADVPGVGSVTYTIEVPGGAEGKAPVPLV